MKPNKNIYSQIKSCIDFVQKICIIHGKVKAPVAQLDRASPSEFYKPLFLVDLFLLKLLYFLPANRVSARYNYFM